MKTRLLESFLLAVASCCFGLLTTVGCEALYYAETATSFEDFETVETSWHERYITENCARCPDCCVSSYADRELEDVHCTPDVCPGTQCPCVVGPEGKWWINATLSFDDTEEEIGHE